MNKRIVQTNHYCMICGDKTSSLDDPQLELSYDVCNACGFIYKQPTFHVGLEQEKARYLEHHNDERNIAYKTYLEQFIQSHISPLKGIKTILDFGSGPTPLLAQLLALKGFEVTDYDPFFHNDLDYQNNTYDLIILTEVLEHIFDPLTALEHLLPLLEKGGKILIMTQFRDMNIEDFLTWWYRRDITHVSFFNNQTFTCIADYLNLEIIENNHKDVILYTKAWWFDETNIDLRQRYGVIYPYRWRPNKWI